MSISNLEDYPFNSGASTNVDYNNLLETRTVISENKITEKATEKSKKSSKFQQNSEQQFEQKNRQKSVKKSDNNSEKICEKTQNSKKTNPLELPLRPYYNPTLTNQCWNYIMEEIKSEILKLNLDPVQQIILVMGPNNHLWMRHNHSMSIPRVKIHEILTNAGFENLVVDKGICVYKNESGQKIQFNYSQINDTVSLIHFHMSVKTCLQRK